MVSSAGVVCSGSSVGEGVGAGVSSSEDEGEGSCGAGSLVVGEGICAEVERASRGDAGGTLSRGDAGGGASLRGDAGGGGSLRGDAGGASLRGDAGDAATGACSTALVQGPSAESFMWILRPDTSADCVRQIPPSSSLSCEEVASVVLAPSPS